MLLRFPVRVGRKLSQTSHLSSFHTCTD